MGIWAGWAGLNQSPKIFAAPHWNHLIARALEPKDFRPPKDSRRSRHRAAQETWAALSFPRTLPGLLRVLRVLRLCGGRFWSVCASAVFSSHKVLQNSDNP